MIFGSDQGAGVSVDGGSSWSSWFNQPTAQFYHVAVDNDFPYHVYGAQQDNSNLVIASSDDSGAISIQDWYSANGGECGFVIPDPRDSNIVYSNAENFIIRWNKKTDQARVISAYPVDASGHAASDLTHRFN